ncbi:MAG: Unknown protein [uncultured Campylobacterales bacterium]|uniref:Cadmium carbonic anhydrase n=1 Tax=uncultured Campylobacterales bacterium TaxID=352960 RepID=A0A6S6SJ22_9BACT|nr:MAG: Unknown protein [uncultured Campylobacterales bacterium]
MKKEMITMAIVATLFSACASTNTVVKSSVSEQKTNLTLSTAGKGFGPQSPRDIDVVSGSNTIKFSTAPKYQEMNLCNIHFHKNAEHKGGEFTTSTKSGYKYSGSLNTKELTQLPNDVCSGKYGGLNAGDTIELHYVHSTAKVNPGPTLGACLSDAIKNPQLRVEAQVYVLVNDKNALDFTELTKNEKINGFNQAVNIPNTTGTPVEYAGSTTGPSYNEQGSPFQVTWNVRPKIAKVNIKSVGKWCEANIYNEDHAHGVRNLVTNPDLISEIK